MNTETHYHNTNNESGKTLVDSKIKALSQEEKVLAYFERHPNRTITAEEIEVMVLVDCPLTSSRRAITNLCKQNKIEKTQHQEQGRYGKMIYSWKLKFKTELF